jgi:SAM-dependent methyltransferase
MAKSLLKSLLRKVPLAAVSYHWLRRQKAKLGLRRDFRAFAQLSLSRPARLPLNWADRLPYLEDRTATTSFDRHYVYHTSWAARALARTRPACHVDISSSLYFCGIVSAFVPVKFYDYRPADLELSNLTSDAADLTALPFADRSIESLSCMHVVEHIGLGRYGDPLDPDGDLKAMSELARVLAPGGSLLFVVPVGKPLIRFNGHRIYAYEQIVSSFSELELAEFALIPDDPAQGGLVMGATKELADAQDYGCGCFWFRRAR